MQQSHASDNRIEIDTTTTFKTISQNENKRNYIRKLYLRNQNINDPIHLNKKQNKQIPKHHKQSKQFHQMYLIILRFHNRYQ